MKPKLIHGNGNQLYIDGLVERPNAFSGEYIENFLISLVPRINMTKIAGPFTADGTSHIVVAESNLTCRLIPETNQIALDCFSCNEFDGDEVISYAKEAFNLQKCKARYVKRGLDQSLDRENIQPTEGNHIFVDAGNVNHKCSDFREVEYALRSITHKLSMYIKFIHPFYYVPEDERESGVTCVGMFSDIHNKHGGYFSFHSYPHPKRNYFSFDWYCDKTFKVNPIVSLIKKTFEPEFLSYKMRKRKVTPVETDTTCRIGEDSQELQRILF